MIVIQLRGLQPSLRRRFSLRMRALWRRTLVTPLAINSEAFE